MDPQRTVPETAHRDETAEPHTTATSVGDRLRQAREHRGLSLDQVALATKIRTITLAAIERDAFDQVPAGIFRRGLLRSYASHVGLDPEDVVKQYREQFETETSPPISPPAAESKQQPFEEDVRLPYEEFNADETERRRGHWQLLLAILVVGGLAYYFTVVRSIGPIEAPATLPSSAPAAPAAPSAQPGRGEGAANGPTESAVATAGNQNDLRVEIKPQGLCWVSATVDGTRVVYRLMQAGESQTLEGSEIMLRVGEPAALGYSINGVPGRVLGPAGTPVTVAFNTQNYREFLRE